jgi:hypothetical protein
MTCSGAFHPFPPGRPFQRSTPKGVWNAERRGRNAEQEPERRQNVEAE